MLPSTIDFNHIPINHPLLRLIRSTPADASTRSQPPSKARAPCRAPPPHPRNPLHRIRGCRSLPPLLSCEGRKAKAPERRARATRGRWIWATSCSPGRSRTSSTTTSTKGRLSLFLAASRHLITISNRITRL